MQKPDKLNTFGKVMILVAFLIAFLVCGACGWFWYITCLNPHQRDMMAPTCGSVGYATPDNPRWQSGTREADFHPGTIHLTLTAEATD